MAFAQPLRPLLVEVLVPWVVQPWVLLVVLGGRTPPSPSHGAAEPEVVPPAPTEPTSTTDPAQQTTPSEAEIDAQVEVELTAAADAFAEGRNTAAWAALDRAEALRPSPDYDYMRGLIRQYQGRCDLAVEHWARYLDSNPAPEDARALQTSIDECGGLPEPEEPIVDPTGADSDPDEDDDRPRPLPPPRPWHRDVTGGVLLGVGIASLAATAGLWAGAGVAQRRGPNSPGLMLHDDRITQSRRLSFAGVGTGVLGTALVVGAIIRYVQMARRQGPSPAARRPRSLARIPRWP